MFSVNGGICTECAVGYRLGELYFFGKISKISPYLINDFNLASQTPHGYNIDNSYYESVHFYATEESLPFCATGKFSILQTSQILLQRGAIGFGVRDFQDSLSFFFFFARLNGDSTTIQLNLDEEIKKYFSIMNSLFDVLFPATTSMELFLRSTILPY